MYNVIEEENFKTIKVFNESNDLIETIQVTDAGIVGDDQTQQLLNRAEFLSEYSNTLVYKISE